MTDAEVIKALECCSSVKCYECPLRHEKLYSRCEIKLTKDALNLIMRQQEEIERLKQKRANMFEIIDAFERGKTKGIQELTDKIVEQLEEEFELVVDHGPLRGRYIKKSSAIEIVEGVTVDENNENIHKDI